MTDNSYLNKILDKKKIPKHKNATTKIVTKLLKSLSPYKKTKLKKNNSFRDKFDHDFNTSDSLKHRLGLPYSFSEAKEFYSRRCIKSYLGEKATTVNNVNVLTPKRIEPFEKDYTASYSKDIQRSMHVSKSMVANRNKAVSDIHS